MKWKPSRREVLSSWTIYQRSRWRARWLLLTGRCPGCPARKHWNSQHKFDCYQPGVPISLRKLRKEDGR